MDIQLHRKYFFEDCCIGTLRVGDKFWCYTLEDIERAIKIKNETAIPLGRYELIIDYSPHFDTDMMHILDVPGFEGIRIHWGNTAADTEGCVLIGLDADLDNGDILNSRAAYAALNAIISTILKTEKVWIEITSAAQDSV